LRISLACPVFYVFLKKITSKLFTKKWGQARRQGRIIPFWRRGVMVSGGNFYFQARGDLCLRQNNH
jgi:hypothetical protein